MKYRKKPVEIEAIQWDGNNTFEVREFCDFGCDYVSDGRYKVIIIETLEGKMAARKGDYIIKGVNGELYPCKQDIFEKTYEVVEHGD